MDFTTPHFLLYSTVDRSAGSGRWQFALRTSDGAQRFEAADAEPDLPSERLDLLTVIRALESLDQPSRVTLVDCSDYIWKGVLYGLPEWRSNGWRWEFFGQMVLVKNSDLWQRLDRALRFHNVECRRRRIDQPHNTVVVAKPHHLDNPPVVGIRERLADWVRYAAAAVVPLGWRRRIQIARKSLLGWVSARSARRPIVWSSRI